MEEFRDCLVECGLSDLGFSGYQYTWDNKRDGEENIQGSRENMEALKEILEWKSTHEPKVRETVAALAAMDVGEAESHSPAPRRSALHRRIEDELAGASHVVYETHLLEAEAAAADVPPSILDPELSTGYHFRPIKNWINAPMFYKGWYHFFYQYNPKGAVWGNIVWAHSVSRDLINWVALETAIQPSIKSDKYGCWSGSATILRDGTPAIMYTGIDRGDINYETFYDPVKRRRILWGWANESDTAVDDVAKGWAGIQAIPRKVWLDPSGRQLMQWPVEELEALRAKKPVSLKDRVVKRGEHVEVTGLRSSQADVEVSFEVPSLEGAEALDPALANDAQKLCSVRGADVEGGVGPFGLWVLASSKLEEKTAVFFRVFKAARNINSTKPVVLMCSDPTTSSLNPNLYKPTFAGFVDTDIAKGKISLRSLIDRSVIESFGAGGRTCILSRVYPTLALGKNAHLHVFNNGKADIKVSQLTAWEMKKPALMNGA
ncbi:Beta-fructofuranosidase, insoluble isoenzyme 2 [Triticum urartu]|uniref:Beta-fructofuranosidase, insoluble isoenzyme 2 n=1 Tax=Triticum urartu TaxID=4572 RepID=M8B100_TRIUA|nr:Beta-fructofuranosidase, insoluble isoenzyme 2 [Triticum urartu]